MLSNGKRMESNLESYNRNPDYYFNSDNKSLHYYSLDGKNYFILEGNHRSVIARFALHYKRKTHLHGVNIEKLKIIDKEMLSCYLKLKCFIESELLPFRVDSEPLFSFHDGEEIGPRMLARIAKKTGLTPEDL